MNLDDISVTAGVGRDVLESRIALLVARVRQLQADIAQTDAVLARVTASNAQLVENMGSTQRRCTELLEQTRTLLACGYPIGSKSQT
jgi:phage shock protein A